MIGNVALVHSVLDLIGKNYCTLTLGLYLMMTTRILTQEPTFYSLQLPSPQTSARFDTDHGVVPFSDDSIEICCSPFRHMFESVTYAQFFKMYSRRIISNALGFFSVLTGLLFCGIRHDLISTVLKSIGRICKTFYM